MKIPFLNSMKTKNVGKSIQYPSFALLGRYQKGFVAVLAATVLTPGLGHTATVLDFSSGTWDLPATNGDFYRQQSFLIATDNGIVDPNGPANGTWGWGDTRSCSGFGCGGAVPHLTTVTFNDGLDTFDFLKVTILQNNGGMTFTADGGLSTTFAAGDFGLKVLNWTGISVIQIRNLTSPSSFQGASNIRYSYIDNLQVSAVPVPAAAWLFGSGLLGLTGVARRRKA